MTAPEERPLTRWIDTGEDSADARFAALFRRVEQPEPLLPAELARVGARLRSRSLSPRPVRYALLLATGMFAGTGFAVASYGVQRLLDSPSPAATVAEVQPAPPLSSPAPRRGIDPKRRAGDPAPSVEAPAPATPAQPDSPSSALGRESELLARALAKLRRDGDPAAALALLDEHAREFPRGALRREADVARVDALLGLGREEQALALLERLPVDRLGRGAELRVIRGELRAKRDPQAAVADFGRALSMGLSRELEERALFGRAASRLKAGAEAAGRADLKTYVERYPAGRFAAEARRRLAPQ